MSTLGILYLVPTPLGEEDPHEWVPAATIAIARRLTHWIVETPKVARRFLKAIGPACALQSLHIEVLDKNSAPEHVRRLLAPLERGHDVGLVSDAGCPALADPGAALVRLAHLHGIRVAPLPGPSSVLLALMGSGMNGQHFAFHGYLPVDSAARRQALRDLEHESRARDVTQIAIETPYRNEQLLRDALAVCNAATVLGMAIDLTRPEQQIVIRTVAAWREYSLRLERRPAVFLLYAGR